MTKQFDWIAGADAGFRAEMPNNVTLVVYPDKTKNFGTKAARGTTWRGQASHWEESTRTMSRYGRDEYNVQHKTAKLAMAAVERIYLDAQPLIVDPRGALGTALLRNNPRSAYPGITFED